MFCSGTPAMYKPPQHAFSPHIASGYTAQQHSQPVIMKRLSYRLGSLESATNPAGAHDA
jgi:hypothetical protein